MTSTSWFKLFGIGACLAMAAGACTVSSGEGDEDDDITTGSGGSGGDGGSGGNGVTNTVTTSSNTTSNTSSSSSSTTSTTTSTSTTGSGGAPEEVECETADSDLGDVATCEVPDNADCCSKCIVTKCCEGYSKCYATDPVNVCGGTEEGFETDSEIYAFQECMLNVDGGALAGTEEGSDFDICIGEVMATVSDPVCEKASISGPTNELAVCMAGGEEGIDGCFAECLDNTFDEDSCTY